MRKILVLLLALISYTVNAQVYERTVTAKDALTTKGTFVYGVQIVPVPNISYVEWSVSGTGTPLTNSTGWHKTFVAGDKYASFSSDYRLTWSYAIRISDITETDPVVRAINGIVKATGTNIGAAIPNTDYLVPNGLITPNTKTKITYDSRGLVTAGADATTSDITEGARLYFTDARVSANADVQAGLLGRHTHLNMSALNVVSGYNSGDETRSTLLTKMGYAYSGADGYLKKEDFSLFYNKQAALTGTGLVYSTNGVITYDTNTYLTSLSGAVLVSQIIGQSLGDVDNRIAQLWATYLSVTDTIEGNISGNSGSVTNGVYTTGAGTVYLVPNGSITGSTKTKITYDAKGLVTAGADATTADIADGSNKRYVTDANLVVIGNTSNTNTGDNAINSLYSSLVTNAAHTGDATGSAALTLATVNSNVGTYTKLTVNAKGLVTAASAATTSDVSEGTNLYYTDVRVAANTAVALNTAKITNATHTGDATGATALTLATVNSNIGTYTKITINAKGLATAGAAATTTDIAEGTNLYYTDVKVAANTAVALNTAKATNATHTGAVTGSTALIITDKAVTLAKMNDMATASFIGRNTTGTGVPEIISAATARTMMNLDLLNDQWFTSYDYAGNVTNLFKISKDNVLEFAPKLGVNAFYDVLNSGFHDIVSIPISAASADGTKHGIGVSIGGTRVFDLSMLSDGAGGVDTGDLTLLGHMATTTFTMTYGAVNGYTMHTDASGNGYWAATTDPYLGTWNATTNSPSIADGTGSISQWYRTVTGGTWNSIVFTAGDDVRYNGSIWQRIPGVGYTLQTATSIVLGGIKIGAGITMTGDVASVSTAYAPSSTVSNATHSGDATGSTALTLATVNSNVGTYTKITINAKGLATAGAAATTTDIAEGTNLYYTDVRVAANSAVAANTAKVTNTTHTGDVTGATALTIANNAVSLAKFQQITTASFLGRITAATGNVEVLSVANVQSMLGLGTAAYTATGDYATAGHNHTGVYQPLATVLTNTTAAYTTTLDTKLSGIADGAEVNVNADWNAVSGDALILNKPNLSVYVTGTPWTALGYITTSALSGYSLTSHNHTLDALSNVSITSKATGDLVKWSGSAWVNFAPTYVTAAVLAAYGYITTDIKWNGGSAGLVAATGRTSLGLGTAAVADLGTSGSAAAYGNHTHTGVYMPYVTANSGYNLNTGTTAGTVAAGDHLHTGVYQAYTAILAATTASYTTALDSKLTGIAAGAEVNVNADWNATSGDAQILNKPTIPTNNNQLTNGNNYISTADLSGYSITSHNHTLDGLSNVTMTGKQTGDIVKWSGSAWVPFTPNYVTGTPWTSLGYITSADFILLNDQWLYSYDYAGNRTPLLKISKDNVLEFAPKVGINALYAVQNPGMNTMFDIPLSSEGNGIIHGTKIVIGGVDALSIYGTGNSSGSVDSTFVDVHSLIIRTGAAANRIAFSKDSRGLVEWRTFTTADVAASTNKNYITDAQQVLLGNTSGTNSGDNTVNTLYSSLVTNAAHTGDATGATVLTLATVNTNVGTYNGITVNAKGLVTAATSGNYATGGGSATGTNSGDNAINSLYSSLVTNATHTGDATGATALTLATVNSNIGTYNGMTVNAKGLVTAAADMSYITVASARTAISLTTIGTSGASTYNSSTGVLNIPQYPSGSGTGTVTSVGMTVPTGLSISGTPITTSGTLALALASGYAIPTTASIAAWNALVTMTYPGVGIAVSTGSAWGTSINPAVQALSGTSVSWNCASGINATLTLSGTTTVTLSNVPVGMSGNIKITNPSGTANVLNFAMSGKTVIISPSVYVSSGRVLTSGASKKDMYSWYYDGTNLIINGSNDYK